MSSIININSQITETKHKRNKRKENEVKDIHQEKSEQNFEMAQESTREVRPHQTVR